MKERILNAINDSSVTFFLFPTAKLKEMILENSHPHIQRLNKAVKAAFLEDKALPISKQDVLNFLEERLPSHQYFVLSIGEIRVSGVKDLIVNKD